MYRDDHRNTAPAGSMHGDVGLGPLSKLPDGAKPIKGNKIALGEATGHHHILDAPGVQMYEVPISSLDPAEVDVADLTELFGADGTVKVVVTEDVPLRHQEHGTLDHKAGCWIVLDQYEWLPDGPRRATD